MLRLFFALRPTSELAAQLLDTVSPVLAQLEVAPVPVGNLHATLCFIGAVAPERAAALRAAAATVRGAPITIEFDVLEFWEKPRVLVAESSRECARAATLAQRLREVSIAAGFAPDDKPLRAHLTLARKISPTSAQKISWPQKFSPGFVVRCDRFALMESRRGEHGSIYSVVEEWALDGTA